MRRNIERRDSCRFRNIRYFAVVRAHIAEDIRTEIDRLVNMSQKDSLVEGKCLAAGVALLRIEAEAAKNVEDGSSAGETDKICPMRSPVVRRSSLPSWLAASKVRRCGWDGTYFYRISSDLASWLINEKPAVGAGAEAAEYFCRASIREGVAR